MPEPLQPFGSPREGYLSVMLAGCIPVIHLAVRWFGWRRVQRLLAGRRPFRPRDAGLDAASVDRLRKRMRVLRRRIPAVLRGNCLSQSMALWWLLSRRGIATTLHIGTARRDGRFVAHAWVEHDGIPLNAGRRVRRRYAAFDHPLSSLSDA